MTNLTLNVNGRDIVANVDDTEMPLHYFLRNELDLRGPRFGCGLGQCGACMVDIDGVAVRSCIYPIGAVRGKVLTLDALGSPENPNPVQRAFIEEQAVHCAYCINGMIMQAIAFLKQTPKPSEEQVREALGWNLCRCGTHLRIARAVLRAAKG